MKDNLQDLISHIHGLSDIDVIKIMGTDTETNFAAVAHDDSGKVLVEGSFKDVDSNFKGTFGLPNLVKLKTILSLDDYNEDASIVTKRDEGNAKSIYFENKDKDFNNEYRLMPAEIVNTKVGTYKFLTPPWNVTFNPTVEAINRLKRQSQANSEENLFKVKVENNDIKMYFGDPATHNGAFIFHANVNGTFNGTLKFPANLIIQILNMAGDKTMKIAEKGIIEITIDSGIAVYRYFILAQGK
jgi:hypothetical protein